MKKKIIIPALLVIAGVAAGIFYFKSQDVPETNIVRVSGNIEITDIDLSFKIPGRIEKRLVSEGEMFKAGQIVARLDNQDLVQEMAQRKAQVAAAQATLAELKTGSRPEEIAQAEAVLERAQADGTRTKTEWERQKKLYEREVISAREYDLAKTNFDGAEARIREAKEILTLVRKGPRQEKIDLALAGLEQARKALALAETRMGYSVLHAPISGIVLSENVEAGEYVSPGTPVVTAGDLIRVYLRAYINETDLGRVKLGQKVRLFTDTFPGKAYEGKITFIASQAEFTPKNVQTQKERVKLVYRIKVDIPNPNLELKPGMPADGEIILTQ
ncbi:MAG: efflux RND transporter periplasmic adaptor subunit [Deltaproteobacteria bacterium]|nr:efflux RND transporter periplasmic adaptor subunit [Deltaproteobacteria bacterium]